MWAICDATEEMIYDFTKKNGIHAFFQIGKQLQKNQVKISKRKKEKEQIYKDPNSLNNLISRIFNAFDLKFKISLKSEFKATLWWAPPKTTTFFDAAPQAISS